MIVKKMLALIMVIATVFCLVACGGGKCEGCGKSTKNKLTVAGETGYICDDCCQSEFGMSFKDVKALMESAGF